MQLFLYSLNLVGFQTSLPRIYHDDLIDPFVFKTGKLHTGNHSSGMTTFA